MNYLETLLILSTALEFSPLFQAIKSIRTKKVQDISAWTYVLICITGGLWLYYGISISSWPLIIGNAIKLGTSFAVICIYLKYRKHSG